jgi:SAM-dependent methyltransferase
MPLAAPAWSPRLVAPMVGRTGRTVGVDFDPLMIEVAKALGSEIEWQHGDLQRLPFPEGVFDLVLCQQGLQFVPDHNAGLREMYRVLHPGGRLALNIWSDLTKSPGQAALFGALGAVLGKDMSKPSAWSLTGEREVLALVSGAGFVDVKASVKSLRATYPSAQVFVESLIDGTSKLTREALAQIPADRKAAFVDEVAEHLRDYETTAGLQVSNESRLVMARKPDV